jgi:hypothetical protein
MSACHLPSTTGNPGSPHSTILLLRLDATSSRTPLSTQLLGTTTATRMAAVSATSFSVESLSTSATVALHRQAPHLELLPTRPRRRPRTSPHRHCDRRRSRRRRRRQMPRRLRCSPALHRRRLRRPCRRRRCRRRPRHRPGYHLPRPRKFSRSSCTTPPARPPAPTRTRTSSTPSPRCSSSAGPPTPSASSTSSTGRRAVDVLAPPTRRTSRASWTPTCASRSTRPRGATRSASGRTTATLSTTGTSRWWCTRRLRRRLHSRLHHRHHRPLRRPSHRLPHRLPHRPPRRRHRHPSKSSSPSTRPRTTRTPRPPTTSPRFTQEKPAHCSLAGRTCSQSTTLSSGVRRPTLAARMNPTHPTCPAS